MYSRGVWRNANPRLSTYLSTSLPLYLYTLYHPLYLSICLSNSIYIPIYLSAYLTSLSPFIPLPNSPSSGIHHQVRMPCRHALRHLFSHLRLRDENRVSVHALLTGQCLRPRRGTRETGIFWGFGTGFLKKSPASWCCCWDLDDRNCIRSHRILDRDAIAKSCGEMPYPSGLQNLTFPNRIWGIFFKNGEFIWYHLIIPILTNINHD